jgi:DNA-binding response OmpR family regulator
MTIPTMVICDDETDLVDELAEWFSVKGWMVRTAGAATDALNLLATSAHTTCLILDLQMPKTSCAQVLKRIEGLPRSGRPDVIALITGDADMENAPMPEGADLIFIKPADLSEMTATITAFLSNHSHWPLLQPGVQGRPVFAP